MLSIVAARRIGAIHLIVRSPSDSKSQRACATGVAALWCKDAASSRGLFEMMDGPFLSMVILLRWQNRCMSRGFVVSNFTQPSLTAYDSRARKAINILTRPPLPPLPKGGRRRAPCGCREVRHASAGGQASVGLVKTRPTLLSTEAAPLARKRVVDFNNGTVPRGRIDIS